MAAHDDYGKKVLRAASGAAFTISLVTALLSPALGASHKANREQKQEDAMAFLNRVRSLTDIRAAGSLPFRLEARIEAASLEKSKPPYAGSLVLIWQSPSQWREEVSLSDYKQIQVASGGKLWTSRNLSFEPLRVYQLEKLMDLRSRWTFRPEESIAGFRDQKRKQDSLRCAEIRGETGGRRQLCADSATLLPAYDQPAVGVELFQPSSEYGEYVKWGDKQFPREMKFFEDGKLAVSIEGNLTAAPNSNASTLFAQPSNATEWDWCADAEPPRALRKVPPQYPEAERWNRHMGMVSVYTVIGSDGSLSNLQIVRSAGSALDAATVAALEQWRYRPAMCGSNPVPFETVVEVRYTLRE